MTTLAGVVASTSRSLPEEHVDVLAGYVESLSEPTTVTLMQACDLVPLPGFRTACEALWKAWGKSPTVPGMAVSLALRAACESATVERADQSVTAVVTGPTSWHVPVRHTADVIQQLVQQARDTLLLSSFAAYKVPSLVEALKDAICRGVTVRMLLETVADSGGAIAHDATQAFAAIPGLRVVVWPADQRPDHGQGKVSMHAKVVIADRHAAFVTSANLTGSALERNLEVGVLVVGGTLPGRLLDHFTELQANGTLKPLTG